VYTLIPIDYGEKVNLIVTTTPGTIDSPGRNVQGHGASGGLTPRGRQLLLWEPGLSTPRPLELFALGTEEEDLHMIATD
jgi:hypothetical protein